MAGKIIGINLNGIDYDYEDEETSNQAEENTSKIGDLSDLETTEKASLVGAINEIASSGGGVLDKMFFGTKETVAIDFDFYDCYTAQQVLTKNASSIAKLSQLEKGIVFVSMFQDILGDSGDDSTTIFYTGQGSATLSPSDDKRTTAHVSFSFGNTNWWEIHVQIVDGTSNNITRRTLDFVYEYGETAYYIDGLEVLDGSDLMADLALHFTQYE